MGVRKFFELLGDKPEPISIDMVSNAQGLNTSTENGSSFIGVSNSIIKSTINQDLTIDWGDGTTPFVAHLVANTNYTITGNTPSRYIYSSPFNYPVTKQIKFTFQDATKIVTLDLRNYWLRGNLSVGIDTLTNLTELRLNNNRLDTIPSNISSLPLQVIGLLGSPSLGGIIPSYIFDISTLKTLDFRENPIGALSYADANYDRLLEFPVLDRLDLDSNNFTELFSEIFDCVELVTLAYSNQRSNPNEISPTIPANANSATKWKTYISRQNYRSVSNVDSFVDNLYTFVTTNAAISGASTLAFRGMTITFDQNSLPTGVFKQPSGYSAGVSNGSPGSQQEKLWVLVNQYLHTITQSAYTVTAITVGATTQVTVTNISFFQVVGAQLQVGSIIEFANIIGTVGASLNGSTHIITNISGNVITISTNTTGLTYTSGGTIYRVTF